MVFESNNLNFKYTKHPQTGNIQILEENSYYPFGLKHEGYNPTHEIIEVGEPMGQVTIIPVTEDLGDPYKFKFGGMEYQSEMGLDFYDFGARNYDPAIGRWMNVDLPSFNVVTVLTFLISISFSSLCFPDIKK